MCVLLLLLWVPKTTLSLCDLLVGLTGLSKVVIFIVAIYYSGRIQIKISKRKRYMGKRPRETRFKLPSVLAQWSHTDAFGSLSNNV